MELFRYIGRGGAIRTHDHLNPILREKGMMSILKNKSDIKRFGQKLGFVPRHDMSYCCILLYLVAIWVAVGMLGDVLSSCQIVQAVTIWG